MTEQLEKISVFPTGMRLNEYVAWEYGVYKEEGLDVEILWDVLRGQQIKWKDIYKERPQDEPFVKGEKVIGSACAWGTLSNAGAGMGRFVPDVHGVSPWGIFVRPDSKIRQPEDLADVPVGVGLRAGSHFNVPWHLEKYMPLEKIKAVNIGGFGARLKALVDGEFEAVSLLPPQIDMAKQLGMREVIGGEFKTIWWVDPRHSVDTLRRYFRALDKAEAMITADPQKYLPLWEYSVSEEFEDYDWDFSKFSRGERFVHEPITREWYEDIMSQVKRWGLDDYLQETDFDKLSYTIAA